jgi:hypothetical protein
MKRWMSPRLAPLWIALGLACGAALPAAAGDPVADPHGDALRRQLQRWEEQEAAEAQQRQAWQEREKERIRAVKAARADLAEAEANRVKARDGAYDGIKRSEWARRAKQARSLLDDARRELEDLHEEARQAEVPPGWFEADD